MTKAWLGWVASAELAESDRWLVEDNLEKLDSLTRRLKVGEAPIAAHVQSGSIVAFANRWVRWLLHELRRETKADADMGG